MNTVRETGKFSQWLENCGTETEKYIFYHEYVPWWRAILVIAGRLEMAFRRCESITAQAIGFITAKPDYKCIFSFLAATKVPKNAIYNGQSLCGNQFGSRSNDTNT